MGATCIVTRDRIKGLSGYAVEGSSGHDSVCSATHRASQRWANTRRSLGTCASDGWSRGSTASRGSVIDSVTLEVEPIASLVLPASTARVIAGGSYSVEVTLADAAGRTLGGGSGRIHAAASTGVTTFQRDMVTGTVLEFTTTTAGSSTVTVTADAATSTLAVQAVEPSAITAIDVGTGDYKPTYNPNNQVEVVWSTPSTAAGPVYGAKCNWQIGDPSVTLVSNSAESDLGRSPYDNSQFMLARPGRFDVVCTIGTAQLAVTLRR
jgi:hypothetical protein